MALAYYLQKLSQQHQLEQLQQQQDAVASSKAEAGIKFSQSCPIYPHQASEFGHILKAENPSSSRLSSIPNSFSSPNAQQPASPSTLAPNLYSDFYRLQLNQTLSEQPERASPVVEPVQQEKIPKTSGIESQQELSLLHREPLHIKPYSTSENEATHTTSVQAISPKVHSEIEQIHYATSGKNFQPSEFEGMIARYHGHQRLGKKYMKLIKNHEKAFKKLDSSLKEPEHSPIPDLRTNHHLRKAEWSPTPYSEEPMESGSRTRESEVSFERDSRNGNLNELQAQTSYLSETTSESRGSTKPRSSIPLSTAAASPIMSTSVSTNAFVPLFQNPVMQQPLISPSPFLSGFPMNPNFASIEKVSDPADVLARALVISRGNQRKRGEKRPIPNDLKDGRYYERRKRNNAAAKKSRDARKARERQVASKATILETENSCLRNEVQRLKAYMEYISNDLISQGYPILSLLNKLNSLSNRSSLNSISDLPALNSLSNVASLNAYANLSNINMKNLSITNDGN